MERLKYLLIGTLALLIAGCGQRVTETLNVQHVAGPDSPGYGRNIVILPFADYSKGNSISDAHRRNLKVTESITDHLVQNGFGMPIQEDVFHYLVQREIIELARYESASSRSLQNELNDVWSPAMKEELSFYIDQQKIDSGININESPGTHGLSKNTVARIGRDFGADYIVRGRILEYKTREDVTWEPWRKGVLPFIISGTSHILYGAASSDTYDETGDIVSGAIWGAILGGSGNWPFRDEHISGYSATKNSVFWGAAGGGLGKLSNKRGRIEQAVVQLRIWVQEAASGEVVWTNRVRVQVSPETVYADLQYDALFDSAIEKGVSTLVDNFVTSAL